MKTKRRAMVVRWAFAVTTSDGWQSVCVWITKEEAIRRRKEIAENLGSVGPLTRIELPAPVGKSK